MLRQLHLLLHQSHPRKYPPVPLARCRPVLIGTASVQESELVSAILRHWCAILIRCGRTEWVIMHDCPFLGFFQVAAVSNCQDEASVVDSTRHALSSRMISLSTELCCLLRPGDVATRSSCKVTLAGM